MNIGQCATLACLLEATASKPGNVHRGSDFEDLTFPDFVASAVAIGPSMEKAGETGVGQAVLGAVQATQRWVGTNTNLGTIFLLAPLAAVPGPIGLADGVARVLSAMDSNDSQRVYEAIRQAKAGGLGRVPQWDVSEKAPPSLISAMRDAAERDMIARQYGNGFDELFNLVVPWILEGHQSGGPLTDTILHVHVRLMARFPDSLIARKCGPEVAKSASRKAAAVLEAGAPNETAYLRALSDLDFWLRSDHHRRNPGTTADLIAAGLFAVFRDGLVEPPFR
ncbi:MAG: triphosphoribosyl-dephospho-CoA synthase [Pirellulaceae bacterium]